MNRAAAKYYPFQVISRFMINRPGEVFYIGGNDILPAPLPPEQEASAISLLNTDQEKEAKAVLIEHNLRLVVYIAKKFDNTGVGVEDLISIGTIGLIKAINTFNPVKISSLQPTRPGVLKTRSLCISAETAKPRWRFPLMNH